MKFLSLLLSSCLVLTLIGCSSGTKARPALVGKPAPFTSFHLFDSSYRVTEEFYGKPSVILFWASWCSRSRQEVGKFNDLALDPRNRGRVNFLAASLDNPGDFDKIKEAIESQHLTAMEHAYSGNAGSDEAFMKFGGDTIPVFFVLDAEGVLLGSTATVKGVKEFLVPLLSESDFVP